MKKRATILVMFFAALVMVSTATGKTIYVDDDGTTDFDNIQGAIDDANDGDVVIVFPGIYTGDGNRYIDFRGKAITVRSVEPSDPNIVEATVIDCEGSARGFNFHSGEDLNSVLAGLTITNGHADYAGGIYISSNPVITQCTITDNFAHDRGGGIYCSSCEPLISHCIIKGNTARRLIGGGICSMGANPIITNCLIIGNSSGDGGGGISLIGSNAAIIQCTITGNSDRWFGGGIYFSLGSTIITNSILWDNTAPDGPDIAVNSWGGFIPHAFEGMVTNSDLDYTSELTVSYSDIKGGQMGVYVFNVPSLFLLDWGDGNIDAAPCFVEPSYWESPVPPPPPPPQLTVATSYTSGTQWIEGDYHLQSEGWRWSPQRKTWTWDDVTSPCIDAGNPGSLLGEELFSVPADPDNDWGQNLRINMGAYGGTAQASMPPYGWAILADLTNDGLVNFVDLSHWLEIWLSSGSEQPSDLDRNGIVNLYDFSLFAGDWRTETSWPPGQASDPNPADGATLVSRTADLSWTAGSNAISHDVYFGTSSPLPFVCNLTSTTYDPGTMAFSTKHYWRIDEVNSRSKTTGEVWTFTVTPPVP